MTKANLTALLMLVCSQAAFADKPCKARDMDLPGHDIDSVLNVQTWEECSDLCTQNSDCSFWTWVDDSYTLNPEIIHKCHLKNGKSSGSPVAGLVSGVSGCIADRKDSPCESVDTDLFGNDIDYALNVPTWESCSSLCIENSDCFFWTWVDDSYTLNPAIIHKCHLKSADSGSASVAGLVSGASGCTPDTCESKNTDLPGHDIDSVLDVPSWEKCSSLCNEKSDCFFWTWVDDSYTLNPAIIHKCHLKNGHSGSAPITGLVSGSAGCKPADIPRCEAVYADTDLPGNDIDSMLNVATAEECQDLCIKNTDCTFWTWVDDSYTINTAIIHKCHLKNGNPGEASVTGLVSGAATC